MIPSPHERVVKIDFKFNKSRCLSTVVEPLLYSCNVQGVTDLSKLEDITFTLASGKTLVLQAIPTVVVALSTRSAVDQGHPGQMVTYRTFHATVYLEFHNAGSPALYTEIHDIGNSGGGIGGCVQND